MVTERKFMKGIAEIILSVFDNPEKYLTKTGVCQDGHFSPKMLTADRLLQMRSDTLMRLLLYLAHTMDYLEFLCLMVRVIMYIAKVACSDEESTFHIIDSHAGSPVRRKKQR